MGFSKEDIAIGKSSWTVFISVSPWHVISCCWLGREFYVWLFYFMFFDMDHGITVCFELLVVFLFGVCETSLWICIMLKSSSLFFLLTCFISIFYNNSLHVFSWCVSQFQRRNRIYKEEQRKIRAAARKTTEGGDADHHA